jgi:hypothetical protein
MITKGKITDQILRLYTGGSPNDEKEISRGDINLLVGQVINRLLKLEHASVNMGSGDMYPPHTLITQYKISLSGFTNVDGSMTDKFAKLPVMPISLPRNMGVWSVSMSGTEFIPLQSGQETMISSQDQLQYLENQIGYYVEGDVVRFTKDPSGSFINIKLLIIDPTVLGEYDYLAIPAEMEEAVVKEVLTLLGALPKVVDKASDSNSQI